MTWQKIWRSLKTPGLFGLKWRVKTTYTYACPPGHPHAGTRQEVWGFKLRTPSATAPACHRRGKHLCAPLQNYFLYCRLSLLCKSFPSCHVPQNPHKKGNTDFSDLYIIPDFNHKTQYKQEIPLTEKNGQLIHLYLLFSHGKNLHSEVKKPARSYTASNGRMGTNPSGTVLILWTTQKSKVAFHLIQPKIRK